jgi:hypothetical protein
MEKNKPTTEVKVEYNERTKVLIAKTIYTDQEKDLKSELVNTYTGNKAVKRFLSHQKEQKLNGKNTIESAEKLITDLKDKETNLKKGLKDLTEPQKKLIEELRIVGKYQELDGLSQKRKMQESQLNQMKEGFKESKSTYEKIKVSCKSVDFEFD